MSLFKKLSGQNSEADLQAEVPEEHASATCPHTALMPRWDSLEDMGKEDKATSYFCQGCERTFTPQEARPYLG
ncbi:MAG TPA: hypothetical protein VNN10_09215 [Dehalococcoidia bacterium]|nr:hypothetical protein [Dehalococcoidia bacterium]